MLVPELLWGKIAKGAVGAVSIVIDPPAFNLITGIVNSTGQCNTFESLAMKGAVYGSDGEARFVRLRKERSLATVEIW